VDFQDLSNDLESGPRETRSARAVEGWTAFLAKPHGGGERKAEAEKVLALARTEQERTVWTGRFGVNAMAVEPGGRRIAVYSEKVRVIDPATRHELWALPGKPYGTRIAFATGKVALGGLRSVTLWDVAEQKELPALPVTEGMVTALAASPEGALLAAGTQGGGLLVWDLVSGASVRTEKGVSSGVQVVAVAPRGAAVAAGGFDRKVRIFPLPTGTQRVLEGMAGRVGSLAWSPDGTLLAAAGSDRTILVWDASSGEPRRELKGHEGSVVSLAWSPDGSLLASSGQDGTVRIWPLQEGAAAQVLKPHPTRATALGFLPTGELLSGGPEGAVLRTPLRD
jgi:WD40 repeat protein